MSWTGKFEFAQRWKAVHLHHHYRAMVAASAAAAAASSQTATVETPPPPVVVCVSWFVPTAQTKTHKRRRKLCRCKAVVLVRAWTRVSGFVSTTLLSRPNNNNTNKPLPRGAIFFFWFTADLIHLVQSVPLHNQYFSYCCHCSYCCCCNYYCFQMFSSFPVAFFLFTVTIILLFSDLNIISVYLSVCLCFLLLFNCALL